MISIPITEEAYEALKANTPGVDQAPTSKSPDGQIQIWLDPAFVDRLRALSEPGEGYSDVILRLTRPSKQGIPRPIMIWPRR
jgi:predicted CopG family antitoxin